MSRLRKLKIDPYLLLLLIITLFLCYQNYTPNTFLSGWDSLHPEFNFQLYLSRISSVWQEHQGLGAPPSQSHLAELPRMIIIGLFCLIFPMNFVRYGYFFLMIIIGPLGVYLLLKYLLGQSKISSISAFFGALFYLLNLGTMQHFIAPLEMFASKFGYLGLLYLTTIKFIDKGQKKDLIFFSIFTLLSSAMAHTATLWYVYFVGLFLFTISYSVLKKGSFKRSTIIIVMTLALNLYWILPNINYSINHSADVITSKINRLSSEETYYYNKKYGNFSDLILLKNFLFDWKITNNQIEIVPLLTDWINHLKNPLVLFCGYFFSISAIVGIFLSLKHRKRAFISFIPIAVMSSFFLLPNIPVVSTILDKLREISPLFKEAIRSPFTKFSLYLIFCFSIFFGYINNYLLEKIATKIKNHALDTIIIFYIYGLMSLFLIYSLPAFQGHFISSIARVKIPKDYFSLFEWSKNQDDERVLTLPIHDQYGWVYYDWNFPDGTQVYQGAGFTWFGLKQPTLNREFDRWYPYNEQAYREFYYAIYSQNSDLFDKLLQKYRIKYILLDENVFIPKDLEQKDKLFYSQIKDLLNASSDIKFSNNFGEKISIFQHQLSDSNEKIKYLNNYKNIIPAYHWNYIDQAYLSNNDYITDNNLTKNTIIYPERNILTEKERINKDVLLISKNSYQLNLNKLITTNGIINIPNISDSENEFYADLYLQKTNKKSQLIIKYLLPNFSSAIPLKQTIELDSQASFLEINNQIYLFPELIDDNEVFLGETILKLNQSNDLTLFKNGNYQKIDLKLQNILSNFMLSPKTGKLVGIFPQQQTMIKISNLTSQINDCSFDKSKFINKRLINFENQDVVEYKTIDGSICDQISLPDLSQNMSYILAIESKNNSGLPIKICVQSLYTKTCILADELSKNKSFNVDYFLIPSYKSDLSGYRVILTNQSIGDLPTINQIKSIRMMPFPYSFFRSINWQSFQTFNPNSAIFFNQAYEKNWKAYRIYNSKFRVQNLLNTYLPFIFGREIKNHVLANNWANGWVLDNATRQQGSNITIIFLPQYLEYLGFGLLIISFVYVLKYKDDRH